MPHGRRLFPCRQCCDELRAELVCDHQKQVCEERRAQLAFNEELKRQRLVEEQMFSKLWEQDRLAKEQREAQEARRQRALADNLRLGLHAQVTGIRAQRQAAQLLKEEEARLVVGLPPGRAGPGRVVGSEGAGRLAGLRPRPSLWAAC